MRRERGTVVRYLSKTMRSLGYARNEVDICIFNKLNDKRQKCTVCVHVDDLLITSDSTDMLGIANLVCSHHSCLRMVFCSRVTRPGFTLRGVLEYPFYGVQLRV